ncbi:MAG: glycosyltransferase family 2 protein [Deltaproteobacteria bacterium]|nr:glycosyltransferase family 2 protein [Deltaproteobacteria bacterium]
MTSVVFPCFNEQRRIPPTLVRTVEFLAGRGRPWEVIVVDDGSEDRTSGVVREGFGARENVRVLRYETNHGKGFAVREGVLAARGELVLFSDADLSTPIEELAKFEARAADGFDVVVASRVIDGARILTPQPVLRRLSGLAFRALVRGLALSSLHDTQCGFKLLRRATVEPVLRAIETEGFAFDVELLARAERAGLRLAEVPVDWSDARGSKVRLCPDALHMAADLVRLRRRLGARSAAPA